MAVAEAALTKLTDASALGFPGERGPLPHFAGRKAELAKLTAALERTVAQGRMEEGLMLIAGVPGVGKTQLGRRFAQVAAERRGIKHQWFSVGTLESEVGTFLRVGEAIGAARAARRIVELDAKVSPDRVSVTSRFPDLLAKLRESRGWPGSCKALVIFVDELQQIEAAAKRCLQALHNGSHGCPIMLVGMGLQHTRSVLAVQGISRVESPIALGPLSHDEAVDAIDGNLRAFDCGAVAEGCLTALANASHGFPQHIHAYLAAAVEVVRARGRLASGDTLQEALRAGDAKRVDYYQSRLLAMDVRSAHRAMFPIVRRLSEAGTDSLDELEAIKLYDESEYDGERVIDQAVAHGVLTLNADGTVGFGIPSFKQYMTDHWLAHRHGA